MVQWFGEGDASTKPVYSEGVSRVTTGCEIIQQCRVSVSVIGCYQSYQ